MTMLYKDKVKSDLIINDYNEIAPVYDEIMGEDYASILFDAIFYNIQKDIDISKKNRYLDHACGSGAFICKMQKKINADCFGIDLSKNQIEYANRKLKSNNINANLIVGDIIEMEFPKNCDIISINFDALNHIRDFQDWQKLFEKVYLSLNPKGIFFFDINTQKRLLEDWSYPEVILKKNLTYVQVGYEPIVENEIVRRKILMQIFSENNRLIKKSSALIEQISPQLETLYKKLKISGFKINRINLTHLIIKKHIFLKNRIFLLSEK